MHIWPNEMKKHRIRESLKSFFEAHVDPDQDQQLKGTKIEIDEKVKKILALLKNEESDQSLEVENSKDESVAELLKDFYQHYQSLYKQYDHLTGELKQKVDAQRGKDSSSSSSSESDSDDSSKDKRRRNGQSETEFEEMKQEIETANRQVSDLQNKLTAITEEKDSQYQTALNKIKEGEEIIGNFKVEVEKLGAKSSDLLVENEELKQKLEAAGKIEADLYQRFDDIRREKEAAKNEMEDLKTSADKMKDENALLAQEVKKLREEALNTDRKLKTSEEQVSDLKRHLNEAEEENKSLSLKVGEASNEITQAESEIKDLMAQTSLLKEKERDLFTLSVQEKESSARIKELEAQVTGFESELESLLNLHKDMELEIDNKINEAKQLEEQNKEKLTRISELEIDVEERGVQLSTLGKQFEDKEKEALLVTESLTTLRADIDSVRAHNTKLEENVKSISDESSTQIELLINQKTKLEEEYECKSLETAVQIENLREETQRKIEDHIRLTEKLKVLELEVESLHGQKSVLEEQVRHVSEENGRLKEETEKILVEKGLEIAALEEKHIQGEKEASAHRTNLSTRINSLQEELDSLQNKKNELESAIEREKLERSALMSQITDQDVEYKKLKEEHSEVRGWFEETKSNLEVGVKSMAEEKAELQHKIFELEKLLTEKGLELSSLQEIHRDGENQASARIISLQAQKNEVEMEIEREKQEKAVLTSQMTDQETAYSKLNEDYQQIKGWFEESEANLEAAEIKMKEMEEQQVVLHTKKFELQKLLTEKGHELSALSEEINNLQNELDSSQTQKNEVELQIEREKIAFIAKIAEQEAAFNALSEEYKQLKGLFEESSAELEAAERKMKEMAQEFHSNLESKDLKVSYLEQEIKDSKKELEVKENEHRELINRIADTERRLKEQEDVSNKNIYSKEHAIDDLEQTVEELRRDLEVRGDEMSTLLENIRNIEVKLRLSNQKLRVTEQLLTEKEEIFKKEKTRLQQEHKVFEERIVTLSGVIAATNKAYSEMIFDISEKVNSTLTGLEITVQKLEEEYQNYSDRILETSKDLRVTKEQLEKEMNNLKAHIQDKKEQESILKQNIEQLKVKVSGEEQEKDGLNKAVIKLEKKVEALEKIMKEKDLGISGLGEEKREAIRQLCVWIDYQRDQYESLKEILSNKVARRQRPT